MRRSLIVAALCAVLAPACGRSPATHTPDQGGSEMPPDDPTGLPADDLELDQSGDGETSRVEDQGAPDADSEPEPEIADEPESRR